LPPLSSLQFYKIGKILGKGAFGKVNLAIHKLSQHFVAIKSINKTYLKDESSKKKVMQEVMILKKTRHKSIMHLYDTFETDKHVHFVIELCTGGDLLNYVRKRRRLTEVVAKHMFK
jgi:5'-AMP-activated protein kinase catalytic alpha subunit